MTNPAWVLHGIYSDWANRLYAENGPMTSVVSPDTAEGAQVLSEAARALVRIDEILASFSASGRNVDLFRRQYPEWWKGLISYTGGWQSALSGAHVLTDAHMDEIAGFAHFLDGKVVVVEPASLENLRTILDRARNALESDGLLSPELRGYIHRLLQEIQNALDDSAIGSTYDYGSAVERLYVAFKAAESEGTPSKGVWTGLWTGFISGTASSAVMQGATIVIAALTP